VKKVENNADNLLKLAYRVGPGLRLAYDENKILVIQRKINGTYMPLTKQDFVRTLIAASIELEEDLGIKRAKNDKNYILVKRTLDIYFNDRSWDEKLEFLAMDELTDYLKNKK